PFSPEQGRGGCDIRVIRGSQKKSRALDHAWLSCQSGSGPPFVGITRIRFKGSPASHRTLSHCGSPTVCFLLRIRLAPAKSTTSKIAARPLDRKSTRLNSSHEWISYAVFCLKKKKTQTSR